MNKLFKQTELYECKDYDRYVYAEYTNGELTLLNYWQCLDTQPDECLTNGDDDLLNFYNAIIELLDDSYINQIDRFNAAIDMHFAYKNPY